MEQDVFSLSDRKKLLYILSFFSVLGNIVDIVTYNNSIVNLLINIVFISLVIAVLVLNKLSSLSTKKTFTIIIYSLLLNVIMSWALETFFIEFNELTALRTIIITSVLLPISGFILGKKHSVFIGAVIVTFIVVISFLTENTYIQRNIFFLTMLVAGYTYGIYNIISILNKGFDNEEKLLGELSQRNNDISFINKLSLKLADFSPENDFIPSTLKEIAQHTDAKVAVFCEYNENQKALVVKSIEADGVILKSAIKIGGEKILNTISPISTDAYKRITSNKIELLDSFTEVSFGAIPESTNQMIKKLTGINNIYALALIVSGKLYGTTMLAFKKNQKLPSDELLKSYSHLVALTLRRSIAEKALIINENQLRCITDNISDVVFTTDMDLNTKYVSPSIFKLTGETPEAYINKKIERKHPIDSLRLIKSALTEELEKEKNSNIDKKRTRIIEVELYKKDGSKIYVSTHLTFIRDNQGNAIGFQGITRDITKRKLAEIALLESRKKLNTVVETIPDLLFHFNREGKFVNFYQTSKTHQLFIEPSQFVGKSIYDVLDKPLADKIQKAINKTLHKNSYEFEYEAFIGEMKYFHARCAQLNEHEIIIISSDISKLKKSENQLKQNSKELKQLNADKDRFMQILAHDLRNPFNALLGFSDLLLRNFKNYDDDLIKYYLDIIKQTSERTYLMLDELLLWSKSQAGKLPFEPTSINLSNLIASIYSETQTNAQRKNITIKLSVPENFQIFADGNMLKTVIRNLVSNAIKFTRKDGEIKIISHIDNGNVVIAVADNGIGINKTDQEKLWNISNPHTTVGTDNEKGTGLGLLLCKDFVEKHGGKIWVESDEGFGSNFKIQLPLLN